MLIFKITAILFLLKISKIWPSLFSSSKNTFSTWNFTHTMGIFITLKAKPFQTQPLLALVTFQSERDLGLFLLQLRRRKKNRPWVVLWSVPVAAQLAHLFSSASHVGEQGKFGWKAKCEEIDIVWHVRGALLNCVSMKSFYGR